MKKSILCLLLALCLCMCVVLVSCKDDEVIDNNAPGEEEVGKKGEVEFFEKTPGTVDMNTNDTNVKLPDQTLPY